MSCAQGGVIIAVIGQGLEVGTGGSSGFEDGARRSPESALHGHCLPSTVNEEHIRQEDGTQQIILQSRARRTSSSIHLGPQVQVMWNTDEMPSN